MSQASKSTSADEMRPEYDIRGGVRGKYYERYRAGTNVVLLERDVAEVFRDSESVNRALRLLVNVAQASASSEESRAPTRRSTRPPPIPVNTPFWMRDPVSLRSVRKGACRSRWEINPWPLVLNDGFV